MLPSPLHGSSIQVSVTLKTSLWDNQRRISPLYGLGKAIYLLASQGDSHKASQHWGQSK